jgi:hypothetical protein
MPFALLTGSVALAVLAAVAFFFYQGEAWHARAKVRVSIFKSEAAAAYEGSLNRPAEPPIAVVEQGADLAVLWDTYGKDYWACYVRTSQGSRGWVLCTSLEARNEKPGA